jgi:hypothetical protein
LIELSEDDGKMKLKLRKSAQKEEREVTPKDKKEHTPPPAVSEEYTRLPIRQCEPHPDVMMRLDRSEGIEGLSESIRTNGQQVPGMAVEKPDGSGFWIIAGNRRLQACRLLFEKYGEPSSYKALLFHGLSKEEIYSKAIVENESERGERRNLSMVEELAFLLSIRETLGNDAVIRIGVRAGKNEQSIRKKLSLAEELGGELFKNLFKIERRCGTSFKLSHLESLSKHGYDQELLLEIAAIAAASQMNPEEIDPKAAPNLLRYSAPWFFELFPEFNTSSRLIPVSASKQLGDDEVRSQSAATRAANGDASTPNLQQGKEREDKNNGSNDTKEPDEERGNAGKKEDNETTGAILAPQGTHVSIVSQGIFFATCPACGSEYPFDASGLANIERKIEISFYDLNTNNKKEEGREGPEKSTVSPTIILVAPTECSVCAKEFWVNISPRGQGVAAIQSFNEKTLSEPIETQKECTLAHDGRLTKSDGWIVISGQKKYCYKEGKLAEISGEA